MGVGVNVAVGVGVGVSVGVGVEVSVGLGVGASVSLGSEEFCEGDDAEEGTSVTGFKRSCEDALLPTVCRSESEIPSEPVCIPSGFSGAFVDITVFFPSKILSSNAEVDTGSLIYSVKEPISIARKKHKNVEKKYMILRRYCPIIRNFTIKIHK